MAPKLPPQSPSVEAAVMPVRRSFFGVLLHVLCEIIPVALAFALFANLCRHGLAPELAERDRLEGMRSQLLLDRAELLRRHADLSQLEGAMQDPMYAERIRRLERARAPLQLPPHLDASALERVTGAKLASGEAERLPGADAPDHPQAAPAAGRRLGSGPRVR